MSMYVHRPMGELDQARENTLFEIRNRQRKMSQIWAWVYVKALSFYVLLALSPIDWAL